MIRIGCIGDLTYENKRKIKELLFKIKNKYNNDLEIITGGRRNGAETYIKKYALEFGMKYGEYNPANTVYNLYSKFQEDFYGKAFKGYYASQRNSIMASNIDVAIIFSKDPNKSDIKNFIKHIENLGKPYKILD